MRTIEELKEMMEKVENLYNEHMSNYRSNKENLTPEDHKNFNCLMFAVAEAYEKLEKGINGIW